MREVGEGFGHLSHGEGVVEGSDWDISAVDDLGPFPVRVESSSRIEASGDSLASTSSSDGARPETCTRAVGDCGVKGCSQDGDVVFLIGVL